MDDVAALVSELREGASYQGQAAKLGGLNEGMHALVADRYARAANALVLLSQERDMAKADADLCAKSWEAEIAANNALRARLKVMAAATAED